MGYGGKIDERRQARELRAQSWTLLDIARELGVSKSSVSVWVRDVEFVPKPRNRGHSSHKPHPLTVKKHAEIERCRRRSRGADRRALRSRPENVRPGALRRRRQQEGRKHRLREQRTRHSFGCSSHGCDASSAGGGAIQGQAVSARRSRCRRGDWSTGARCSASLRVSSTSHIGRPWTRRFADEARVRVRARSCTKSTIAPDVSWR